ncbi:MAG: type II secretion system F family protein [Pirellulaceae bacterium]|nr:type II secretion system F family protein [Pirellulaceae bacterium]
MILASSYSLLIAGSAFVVMTSLIILVFVYSGLGVPAVNRRVQSLQSDSPNAGKGTAGRKRKPTRGEGQKERTVGLTERIVQAGLYRKESIAVYSTVRIVLMLGPMVMGVVVGQLGLVPPGLGIVYGIIAGVFGTLAPSFWLDYRKSKRQMRMRRALPDALDIIVTCVDAGLSVPAAISRVSRELRTAHPMLATEMAICQREIQLGASTGVALQRFGQRFDLEEVRSLASVIQQAEKFGASITNALRVHGETLRDKRFQRAEEKAQQAGVKIVFPTILCIFPSLFIVLAGPAVARIYSMFETIGQ